MYYNAQGDLLKSKMVGIGLTDIKSEACLYRIAPSKKGKECINELYKRVSNLLSQLIVYPIY